MDPLTVIETHPVQYHAPVYRALQQRHGVPVRAIYASDFSVAGYDDREFGTKFAWDTDLLGGYDAVFLSRVATGGSRSVEEVSARGLGPAIRNSAPGPILLLGYSPSFHRAACFHAWRSGRPMLFRAETTDHAQRRRASYALLRDGLLRRLYARCEKLLYVGRHSEAHFRRLGAT